jgi:hypothetical protein
MDAGCVAGGPFQVTLLIVEVNVRLQDLRYGALIYASEKECIVNRYPHGFRLFTARRCDGAFLAVIKAT